MYYICTIQMCYIMFLASLAILYSQHFGEKVAQLVRCRTSNQ